MTRVVVEERSIAIIENGQERYISLTDIAKIQDVKNPSRIINSWLQTQGAIEYLGLWEKSNNPDFNPQKYEEIKIEAVNPFFEMWPNRWISEISAIGIMLRTTRSREAVYAHSDIAFKFAAWISIELEIHLSTEFRHLNIEKKKSPNKTNDTSEKGISLHDQVKQQVLFACKAQGIQAKEEYRGADWRADVLAMGHNGVKYAFEVQTSQQSLNRTLERQAKYQRDGIVGCWLFEKEPTKSEREDLPMFKIKDVDGQIYVSLKKRKELPLDVFVNDYLQNKIKFRQTLSILPKVDIVFIEMKCWKCGTTNHVYYIGNLTSPCSARINHNDPMWTSDKLIFRPEIIRKVREYATTERGKNLNIGQIKERYSNTIGKSYMSFGCSKCDSIFGDCYVHDAAIDTWYGDGVVDKISFDVNRDVDPKFDLRLEVPHWCHSGEHKFCE